MIPQWIPTLTLAHSVYHHLKTVIVSAVRLYVAKSLVLAQRSLLLLLVCGVTGKDGEEERGLSKPFRPET